MNSNRPLSGPCPWPNGPVGPRCPTGPSGRGGPDGPRQPMRLARMRRGHHCHTHCGGVAAVGENSDEARRRWQREHEEGVGQYDGGRDSLWWCDDSRVAEGARRGGARC
jgi:hypothetical protein